jgi:RNA polymerase-associated protein LEO1
MSDSEDPVDLADEGGDDLFGDDEPDAKSEREHYLSDNELASDRDAVEQDGMDHDDEPMQSQQTKDEIVMDIALSRHRLPKMRNGNVGWLVHKATSLEANRVPSCNP